MNKLLTIILDTDSYKFSHFVQFPYKFNDKPTKVWYYVESRVDDVEMVHFGLQAFIKEYLTTPITEEDVKIAGKIVSAHGCPFNYDGWMKIVDRHGGYLPIKIEALPEGTIIDSHKAVAQITNTDDDCAWLVSYLETALLRAIWYPSTVATISRNIKKYMREIWKKTSDEPIDILDFKLHDFGSRGTSSQETSLLGGMSHLVNFKGTDTVAALVGVLQYYNDIRDNYVDGSMPGFSIPAAEHSTITSWGKDREVEAYENMIERFGHEGKIFACVSDSYDFRNAVENIWGKQLKDQILKSGATLVIRPDSGDPKEEVMFALDSLYKNFGGTVNSKGYRVLNPAVRIIQGDGLSFENIRDILDTMVEEKWAIDNVTFGMGGGLLQKVNRDTFSFAMKISALMTKDGKIKEVYKKPVTDNSKESKKGILSTYRKDDKWITDNNATKNEMVLIFQNGKLLKEWTFDEVRRNASI